MSTHEALEPAAATLECGAHYDALVDQVIDGRAPAPGRAAHQHACTHCRAVIAEVTRLWSPVAALGAEAVRAPEVMVQAVMARVRQMPRHPSYAVIAAGTHGATRVASQVVGAIARRAALEVPGVAAALGREDHAARASGERAAPLETSGRQLVLAVSLVVERGAAIPAVAAQVRQRVRERASRITGLSVATVDVAVVDLAT